MTDITELERRLTAALDRISSGVANAAPADTAEADALRSENANLGDRVERLKRARCG